MARIILDYSLSVELPAENLWPDGDIPEDITSEDVEDLIAASGGWYEVIHDWGLEADGWGSVTILPDADKDK